MSLSKMIAKLRTEAGLSYERFAQEIGVSRQSVQKWENGSSVPELDRLVMIARYFHVSLDTLVLDVNKRGEEEALVPQRPKPQYNCLGWWEFYAGDLMVEFRQALDEGLDMEGYRDLFQIISRLPTNEYKKKLGDVLYDMVVSAPMRTDYPYKEPSDIEQIRALRKPYPLTGKVDEAALQNKIHGAWLGRICGCMLGKPVEGMKRHELVSFLKGSGNYPMHRYILSRDVTEETEQAYSFSLKNRHMADKIKGMPVDDDTNYMVMAQILIDQYGRDFTPIDVARLWSYMQPKEEYCTAERVAYCNMIKGYAPPQTAVYQNPYREWIGAQIRGDYFGYINPGDPETAADMAFRDACISHVKNGIYGEMFVAAMIAAAAVTKNIRDVIEAGLAEIPYTSRLYEAVRQILEYHDKGIQAEDCFREIFCRFDDRDMHDWCHTISNAMIVVASLLYGNGDYTKSIGMAVQSGFDTDCNGATVGSLVGMIMGTASITSVWTDPIQDILYTGILEHNTIRISDAVAHTMKHIKQ